MKSYTKSSAWDGKKRKHPVTSQTTGNTYEVVIHPYGGNDERYLEGCEVTLKQKRRFISREIISRFFDNDNGKITIAYWSTERKNKQILIIT